MWESSQSNSNYFDRVQEQDQFEEKQKLEKQKVELQKQELQVRQQQQDTQQLLVIGGLCIGAALVLVVAIYLLTKAFRGKKK